MTTHRDLTTPELGPCPWCGVVPEKVSGAGYVWCSTRACPGAGDIIEHDRWNRRPRTFTAAEVAEAFAGLESKWRNRSVSQCYPDVAQSAYGDCADELLERITHWLRENEG
jgi:hypothetical protein